VRKNTYRQLGGIFILKGNSMKTKNTRPFAKWSEQDNEIWSILSKRQLNLLRLHTSSLWIEGFKRMNMSTDTIPDFEKISTHLQEQTDGH
jgi:phenylalanine-4-hydroxylase